MTSPLPDWLEDVAKMETRGPVPRPTSSKETPEWLEDLRLWYGLEAIAISRQPRPVISENRDGMSEDPAQKVVQWRPDTPGPRWFSDCLGGVEPKDLSQAPRPASSVPTDQQQSEGFAFPPREENTKASDSNSTSKVADAPDPIALLAERTIEQTGFDLRTGEIVNPARFQKWKGEHSGNSSAGEDQTNASVMEAFRKARIVIEAWIDQENNRALILRGNIQEIVSLPEVFALFQEYAQWGPVFLSKLARHVVFLVENRRKFYDSRAAQPSVVSPEEVTKPRQGKAWIFWSLIFFGLALHLAAVAAWIIWSNSKP